MISKTPQSIIHMDDCNATSAQAERTLLYSDAVVLREGQWWVSGSLWAYSHKLNTCVVYLSQPRSLSIQLHPHILGLAPHHDHSLPVPTYRPVLMMFFRPPLPNFYP